MVQSDELLNPLNPLVAIYLLYFFPNFPSYEFFNFEHFPLFLCRAVQAEFGRCNQPECIPLRHRLAIIPPIRKSSGAVQEPELGLAHLHATKPFVKGRSRLIVTFFCGSPSLGLDHVYRDYGHSLDVKKEYLGFLSNLDTLSVLHYLISKKGVCAMDEIVLP